MHYYSIATASYSRAWKLGVQSVDVYWIAPEQVSKQAKAGEYLAKGAFMVYGKRNYLTVKPEIAVGMQNGRVIGGPAKSVQSRAGSAVVILQGGDKPSDVAKKIQKKIGGTVDEIMAFIPAGSSRIA